MNGITVFGFNDIRVSLERDWEVVDQKLDAFLIRSPEKGVKHLAADQIDI
jgi:hypothetical protein